MSRILLGVTGSVAAVKTPELFNGLRSAGHAVRVAPTAAGLSFFDPEALPSSSGEPPGAGDPLTVRGQDSVYFDADEWPEDRLFRVGEPVLHIELRRWADLLLIAPLDANTLGKLALGLCDNLLTCVYRAWDLSRPVVLAPAMNTLMWQHPATARHLHQLLADYGGSQAPEGVITDPDALCGAINARGLPLRVVPPQRKRLACGDEGMGGMADVAAILLEVERALGPAR